MTIQVEFSGSIQFELSCHNFRGGGKKKNFTTVTFVTIWVFDFCHTLSFWVLSQFEFLSFVTRA